MCVFACAACVDHVPRRSDRVLRSDPRHERLDVVVCCHPASSRLLLADLTEMFLSYEGDAVYRRVLMMVSSTAAATPEMSVMSHVRTFASSPRLRIRKNKRMTDCFAGVTWCASSLACLAPIAPSNVSGEVLTTCICMCSILCQVSQAQKLRCKHVA